MLTGTARVRAGASTVMLYGLIEKFSFENAAENIQARSLHGLVWTKESEKAQSLLLPVCLVAASGSRAEGERGREAVPVSYCDIL